MKKLHIILSTLLVAFLISNCECCTKATSTIKQFGVCPRLIHIDSIMQHHPDSALMMLRSADVMHETSSDFNLNYHSLLTSEALYKTYSNQSNRAGLQTALLYFDSLAVQYPENNDFAILSARAHYMNGVWFYENDSVVEACDEFYQALNTIGNHFNDNNLFGYKAKFAGLTYSRLGDVYFNNGVGAAAVEFYKNALYYFTKTNDVVLTGTYRYIGSSYHLDNNYDSALYYYRETIDLAKKHNQLDLQSISLSESAMIYYELGETDTAFSLTRESLLLPVSYDQRLSQYFTLGSLFAKERQYDSAIFYLKQSINREKFATRTVSAELLMNCYQAIGDTVMMQHYKTIYGDNFTQYRNNAVTKTELTKFYNSHEQDQLQKEFVTHSNRRIRLNTLVFILVLLSIIGTIIIVRRKIILVKTEASSEIDDKNMALAEMKRKIEANPFIDESICKYILDLAGTNNFKSKVPRTTYEKFALTKKQMLDLKDAFDRHYGNFTQWICKDYPELTADDVDYCCLYYLGLKDADISALMQRAYPTVCERSRKLKRIFKSDKSLHITIKNIIESHLYNG